jgi:hypothetical protein
MKKTSIPETDTLKSPPDAIQSITKKQQWNDITNIYALAERLALLTTEYTPDSDSELQETGYYDYPVLKAPIWRWEIIWYFFFGGLAAGSYTIATIASLFGSKEDRAVARAGYYLSL